MNIGIIGLGFVGNAVHQKFKTLYNVLTHDIKKELSNSTFDQIIKNCKIIFVCVPTPMNPDGSCNIDILTNVLQKLNNLTKATVVNKSTVPPGTTELFNSKFKKIKIVYNPEFLTERNAINDFNNQDKIILGGQKENTIIVKKIFSNVFPKAKIIETVSKNAEMVKYFTNCFLANKVSFANEMYDLCCALNIDYNTIVEYVILDKRLGKSHWLVPGPDGDLGFGGHCLPKDLSALIKISDDLKTVNNTLKSAKKTNDKVRKNKDWEKMKGRAVI